ncbi:LacI family DNA-binding transcriptional regulator [Ruficoccus amylovorans]|uniref:LacI family DNA-binding transcriptional regulator n=1 Tax=Ruficoccus amylovorans TaxID=1804625 RepID=A0A842HBT1_9BACT|nr:LacI family DNA-binding transcriptional regulator [Ruficoccus amylovorans]MBC2593024.1 LacI family DNA-binding transcriptional regulator [Ruficoccus amylovorans]
MKKVITQKDLAEATGLNQSTVSLALRNDPRVKEATRRHVLETARRLGYRKDPMLSALASYRSRQRDSVFHGTLVWLWRPELLQYRQDQDSAWNRYLEGARRRCAALGYALETLEVPASPQEQRRLSDILYHRGIEGILVPPQQVSSEAPHFQWEQFAAVTFGWSVREPNFHAVSPNHYQNAITLVKNLHRLGYERVSGVVLTGGNYDRAHFHLWTHGLQDASRQYASSGPGIPPLLLKKTGGSIREVLLRWLDKYRPDAIGVSAEHTDLLVEELSALGLKVPNDIAVATLFRPASESRYAGIYENSTHIGEAAVDMLAGALRRREHGMPPVRRMMQIEGTWVDGPTAPGA